MIEDKLKLRVFEVIVSKTVGQKWEVEAMTEQEAKDNYHTGKMVKENDYDIYAEQAELIYDLLECLWCGEKAVVEGENIVCQECGETQSIEKQKAEMQKIAERRRTRGY